MKMSNLVVAGLVGLSTIAIAQTTPQTQPANNMTTNSGMTAPNTTMPTPPTETTTTTETDATTASAPDQSLANESAPPPKG